MNRVKPFLDSLQTGSMPKQLIIISLRANHVISQTNGCSCGWPWHCRSHLL